MIRMGVSVAALLGLFSCADETLSGYGAGDTEWVLTEIDGEAFSSRATLLFPQEGELQGAAPCNTFQGDQTLPYPWFKAENLRVTRMACPELADEDLFFRSLQSMSLAEVGPDTLFLSNDAGQKMVFEAKD